MQDIVTAISTVGFPIVMAILMFYMMRENNKQHSDEVKQLSDALNQNSVVLGQLKELLEINIKQVKKDTLE